MCEKQGTKLKKTKNSSQAKNYVHAKATQNLMICVISRKLNVKGLANTYFCQLLILFSINID